jgi:hypothetical protein
LAFSVFFSPDPSQRQPTRIVVDSNQVMRLAALWQRARQRPPTAQELRGLIDEHVKEEIYYREALALGLDRNDTIIRRRLRPKMEFLALGDVYKNEPSDKDIRDYMARHAAKSSSEPKASFRQVSQLRQTRRNS